MAWLTITTWTTAGTPVLATVLNNIGLDIRTWGGNVDAGANQLTNLAGITAPSIGPSAGLLSISGANVGIGVSPVSGYLVYAGVSQSSAATVLSVQNSQTGGIYGAAIGFRSSDSVTSNIYSVGRILGVFDAANFGQARITIQTATASEIFQDVLTVKGNAVGIRTISPHSALAIVGLNSYANNAAAISAGLTAGDCYIQTSSNPASVCIVT